MPVRTLKTSRSSRSATTGVRQEFRRENRLVPRRCSEASGVRNVGPGNRLTAASFRNIGILPSHIIVDFVQHARREHEDVRSVLSASASPCLQPKNGPSASSPPGATQSQYSLRSPLLRTDAVSHPLTSYHILASFAANTAENAPRAHLAKRRPILPAAILPRPDSTGHGGTQAQRLQFVPRRPQTSERYYRGKQTKRLCHTTIRNTVSTSR